MTHLPYERFRRDISATEAIEWLKTHRYVWYHAPMDIAPRRLYVTSKLKLWARDKERFAVSVEHLAGYDTLRFRIDNNHLDRIRIPNERWHHGITASVYHEHELSSGTVSDATRGYLRKYGVIDQCRQLPATITRTRVTVHQSNGYCLPFDKLSHAISFCKRQNIRLTARYGRRTRVLVAERSMNGDTE
jgi:hypothetical protein